MHQLGHRTTDLSYTYLLNLLDNNETLYYRPQTTASLRRSADVSRMGQRDDSPCRSSHVSLALIFVTWDHRHVRSVAGS